MCGISLTISPSEPSSWFSFGNASTTRLLSNQRLADASRGPDAQGTYVQRETESATAVVVSLSCGVLSLRGDRTTQPLLGKRGALAWNGQVFGGIDVAQEQNDTRVLFGMLEAGETVESVFERVQGPYAFVYFDFTSNIIHFGVDRLSRRSLLLHVPDDRDGRLVLSSSRTKEGRMQGLEMLALDGGQRGVIVLDDLRGGHSVDPHWEAFGQPVTLQTCPVRFRTRLSLLGRVNRQLHAPAFSLDESSAECEHFLKRLSAAVQKRVSNVPFPAPGAARVAVLFSGGVDCTLLTYLLHLWLPESEPIDLLNVAFERPRGKAPAESSSYDVPDRLSGLDAHAELSRCCPGRTFRFIEVDVPLQESQNHREQILDLIYPSDTEMDLSLAYPLFFASRGRGFVQQAQTKHSFSSAAKVFFSGLGADEQLGGYARHRRAHDRGSWNALIDEIQLDIDRIPLRNLARDDRVISSQGREVRYPYLDQDVMASLAELPVWSKCDPRLPPGQGDKLLVRLAAKRCGLDKAACRVKRAMQFGTRSAKLNPGKGQDKVR